MKRSRLFPFLFVDLPPALFCVWLLYRTSGWVSLITVLPNLACAGLHLLALVWLRSRSPNQAIWPKSLLSGLLLVVALVFQRDCGDGPCFTRASYLHITSWDPYSWIFPARAGDFFYLVDLVYLLPFIGFWLWIYRRRHAHS